MHFVEISCSGWTVCSVGGAFKVAGLAGLVGGVLQQMSGVLVVLK